ncbi:MAG: glycosyltransferase family A protein [Candidatus Paceibacterota bacterium]
MNNPKISLVIVAHNEEKYIGKCIEFAIKHSRGRLHEILVVNNASTDTTKEIAQKYEMVRVVDESQKGQVRARQRSFYEIKGDLIAYIDADTQMPEKWLDVALDEFSQDKNLVCLSGPYVYYDFSKLQKFISKIYWHALAYPIYLAVGYMAVGGNFIIKKEVLDKMNGFDTSIEFYGEDTNIARRASKFGKVKFKLDFIMHSSARRLLHQGTLKIAFIYMLNFLSQVFMKKSATKAYKDVR